MNAGSDIDFVLWGPFDSWSAMNGACGTMTNVINCGYSTRAIETVELPDTIRG